MKLLFIGLVIWKDFSYIFGFVVLVAVLFFPHIHPIFFPHISADSTQPPGNGIDKSLTNKKRKKAKGQEILEETTIDDDFAGELHLSCMSRGLVRAPNIDNGYVAKYNRRKKNDSIFLVAYYECDDNFELDDTNYDRLYCSKEAWVGEHPVCMSTKNGDEDGESLMVQRVDEPVKR